MQTDPVTDDTPPSASCEDPTNEIENGDDDMQDEEMPNEELEDQDPTWSPEEIDEAYKNLNDDDDSAKTCDNPRKKKTPIFFLMILC